VTKFDPGINMVYLALLGFLLVLIINMNPIDPRILVWNTQGAGSREFLHTLKEHVRMQHPQIIVLLETHISGARADEVCQKIGVQGHFRVEGQGHQGGIWILWMEEALQAAHEQFISMEINIGGMRSWYFIAVYANPHPYLREDLWNKLESQAESFQRPWILAGDFNETRNLDERNHGGPDMARRCAKFNN